jgi:hypothetical protein
MFEKHLQLCVLGFKEEKEKTMWHYVAKTSTRHRKASLGKSLTQQIYHSLISTSYLFKMVFQHYWQERVYLNKNKPFLINFHTFILPSHQCN